MPRTPNRATISTRRQKIATIARYEPKLSIKTLAHHIDKMWLEEAWRRTRKDGATGIDKVTAADYEAHLEANLSSLLDRFKSGRYRAPAVRRVHIPKAGKAGATRPIGIPTLEDKVLQRAVAMVLEPIYEHDFLDCSYGFRPQRSAHQALERLWQGLMQQGGGWVIDLDIQGFFDSVDHTRLRAFIETRVRDGVIRRVLGKWLNAGVMERDTVHYPEQGTPQGGVISPLLANIYLHEVLDQWFEYTVKPRLGGRAFMARYADDAVLAFAREEDARRVMAVLAPRLAKYGLRLHPDKTRLVDFRPPRNRSKRGPHGQSFDLLGFTHHWGRSRKGRAVIVRKTATDRMSAALKRIGLWCKTHRHWPLAQQHRILSRKLTGHYAYYGITGNARALNCYRQQVERRWRYWLSRRSRKASLSWLRYTRLKATYPLPPARVVHSVYRHAVQT
jgi:group II intron reverse transcriptase/maturase